MTEPTTEELVERLTGMKGPNYIPTWVIILMAQAAQRLSDLEGKLGEARKALTELRALAPDAMQMLLDRGRVELLMADRIHRLDAQAREALKLTASGGGEDNNLSQGAEHSGSSTPRTSAPSSTGKETGWLIEAWNSKRNEFQRRWWSLGSDGVTDPDFESPGTWTADSVKALRFARAVDAQAYIDATGWTEAKPTDHAWVSL